jgi:hypothetical protein
MSQEHRAIRRLLSEDFPGSLEPAIKVAQWKADLVDDESIRFEVAPGLPRAPVTHRVPAFCAGLDRDGVVVHLDRHVVHGFLAELNVYREDGRTVKRWPAARLLAAFVLPAINTLVMVADPQEGSPQ